MLDNLSYSEQEFLDKLFDFINNLVIKNQKRADEDETADIARKAQEYILAYSGRDEFLSYTSWDRSDLTTAGITDEETLIAATNDPNMVPEQYRDYLLQMRRKRIIDEYEELNDYYRMLWSS